MTRDEAINSIHRHRDGKFDAHDEVVCEWQWAYITNSLLRWHISNYMTEEEFKTWKCGANSSLEYKRLDFTKRERK